MREWKATIRLTRNDLVKFSSMNSLEVVLEKTTEEDGTCSSSRVLKRYYPSVEAALAEVAKHFKETE